MKHRQQTYRVLSLKWNKVLIAKMLLDFVSMNNIDEVSDIVTLLQDGVQKSQAEDIQKVLTRTGKG